MRCTSLVIADRYPVVLQGLARVLGPQRDFKIVASCNDGMSCIEAIRCLLPDIAILDVAMPGLTGLDILAIANSENLPTRLVFFTPAPDELEPAMSSAFASCSAISKDAAPEMLVQSLRQIADGRKVPLASSKKAPARGQRSAAIKANLLTELTDREREIMRLVAEGLSNKEIGRRLRIADGTIKQHLHHIYRKLEIHNRTVLASLAIFWGG
jgi:two-component system, NarL family, nitrate/nitrite response regulator NarL